LRRPGGSAPRPLHRAEAAGVRPARPARRWPSAPRLWRMGVLPGLVALVLGVPPVCAPPGAAGAGAPPAAARGWGGMEPTISTLDQVRERWGPPTMETRGREEGQDTIQWIYDGANAPPGMTRMTVDFGLLQPDGYKPRLGRALRRGPRR